ncbi:hypothetical protein Droror1_Dr00017110 [Drosera rotundifolia]
MFPTKPRLKSTSSTTTTVSPETHYWKSFKPQPLPPLVSSITSLDFSPSHPHLLAATHSASLSLFNPANNPDNDSPLAHTVSFSDLSYSATFRSDGTLLAAGSESGLIRVFTPKTKNPIRELRGHSRGVRVVRYPRFGDKLHLYSGGDDAVVRYWDVAEGRCIREFHGHRDYVRAGCVRARDGNVFASGSYDHTIRVWDVRGNGDDCVMSVSHGKPVECVVFLGSGGGLMASAGGNVVKIWDVVGGGRLLKELECHNKTVTSISVGRVGRDEGEESDQYRLLSVSLDGYFKVFDWSRFKVTFSMRFLQPLMSVAFSPDCKTRAIGTSNGIIYMGRRKKGGVEKVGYDVLGGLGVADEPQMRVLRPTNFRYFHRGQNEKPSEGDLLIAKPKNVKLAQHDKLLKKFRHKDAFVASLKKKNPEHVVAVMEELVARKKLIRCVTNLELEELELLLMYLQKYTTHPRYSSLLMPFASKVFQMRAEDLNKSDVLKGHVRNLKRAIKEEILVQQSLLEIQGIVSPLLRMGGRS